MLTSASGALAGYARCVRRTEVKTLPRRLLVVGVLSCVFGVLAIWDAADEYMQGGISLGLIYWLCLPVGIGLLLGRASARTWALGLIYVGYVLCLLGAALAVLRASDLDWGSVHGASARPQFLVSAVVVALLLYVTQRALTSDCVTEWIARKSPSATDPPQNEVDSGPR
jgi:multisubunit Na+/H+ antiporter MnhG subunit